MAYATVADARAEGVPNSITPEAIQKQLDKWSEFIDAATKQWFEPRAKSLCLDGNDSRVLFLPVPIIQIDALYLNNSPDPSDPTHYSVYNRRDSERDDRRNPMVKLTSPGMTVYDSPDFRSAARFCVGEQNQRLEGVFGFVEEDGTTPALIKEAVLRLTIKRLQSGTTLWDQTGGGGTPAGGGLILSETTDGHTITYHAFTTTPSKPGLNGITNDPEVDRIIDLYRGPIKIASTPGRGGPDRRW